MPDATLLRSRRDPLSWLVLALALVLVVLWPGDVSWLMDEPRLIANAWHANHDHQIAVGGLYGNFGVRYGPLATQVYQLLLLLTHDPFTLVVLHGLLLAGVTGGALLWLARTLELPGWFAAGVLLSPHVVAYERVLWDASFAMPVGAVALASFADFLRTKRPWSLRVCLLTSVLVPTIHPQALPLAAAILGWLAWKQRPELWRDRRALGMTGAIILVFDGFYFAQFIGQLIARLSGSMAKGYPGGGSHAISALAPFLGGKLLCGADYLSDLAPVALPSWLHAIAQLCACLFYPLAGLGVLFTIPCAWRFVREPKSRRDATPREIIMLVLLAGMGLQALLFGVLRIPAAPQYYFGTFALHVLAASLAVDVLSRWKWGRLPGTLYLFGCASLTVEAACSVHYYGFAFVGWPRLTDSVRIVRGLNRFTDTTVLTDVAVYQKAPQALRTLRLLLPAPPDQPQTASGRLAIIRGSGEIDPYNEVVLIEVPSLAFPLTYMRPIEITPLPKDWVPDPGTW